MMKLDPALWYEADKSERGQAVAKYLTILESRHQIHRSRIKTNLELYYGQEVYDLSIPHRQFLSPNATSSRDFSLNGPRRAKVNLAARIVKRLYNKVGKQRAHIRFTTSGGTAVERRRAELAEKTIGAAMRQGAVFTQAPKALRDALQMDLGWLYLYWNEEKQQPMAERVHPAELLWDDLECVNGQLPTQIHRVMDLPRAAIERMYPDHCDEIRNVDPVSTQIHRQPGRTLDLLRLVISWRAATPYEKGMVLVTVDGHELLCEEWPHQSVPFVTLRWDECDMGLYGDGAITRIFPIQEELDDTLSNITDHMRLANSYVEVDERAAQSMGDAQYSNEKYRVVVRPPGVSQAMTIVSPPPIHPAHLQHAEMLKNEAIEDQGVSQITLSAKIPAGMDGGSGRALREFNDLETEIHFMAARAYEEVFVQVANWFVDLYEEHLDAVVPSPKRSLSWKDVRLDRDSFRVELQPASFFTSTPAGKAAQAEQLIAMGVLKPEEVRQLFIGDSAPDLEGVLGPQQAENDAIDRAIDQAMDPTSPSTPEPDPLLYDLTNARVRAAQQLAQLYASLPLNVDEYPPQFDHLAEFITILDAMIAQQNAMVASMQPPGQPPLV